jgi:hypothetical protein
VSLSFFLLSFLLSLLPSLTPHGTSLTIIPPSINRHNTHITCHYNTTGTTC